ncbi:MAG: hypothetical protein CL910_07980 [Deltaproteobacteria bacterium]|jgi:hypothetical protein|nr:hypothetical protein [Deltaproteobacteria bacterium]
MSVRNPIRNAVVLGTAWALLASPWAMAQTDTDKIQIRRMPASVKMQSTNTSTAPATVAPKASADERSVLRRKGRTKSKAAKIERKGLERKGATAAATRRVAPEMKIQPQQKTSAMQAQKDRQFEMKVKQQAAQLESKRSLYMQQQKTKIEQENARTLARIRQMAQASTRSLKISTQKGLR